MKKEDFKLHVKQKIKNHAFEYLLQKKADHSKMDNISYKSFEVQTYLKSQFLHPREAQDLFKWRTRMQPFKANFSKQHKDTLCIFKCSHEDSQKNILFCQKIRQTYPSVEINNVTYEDIFSNNPLKMKSTLKVLNKLLDLRKQIIEDENKEET